MTESFGIGVVSCGFITREMHLPSVAYLPDVHVAGIQNRTKANAEEVAETCREEGWGDPSVYGEDQVAALVEDPAVDGLWVTSPNFTRVDVTDAAVDAVEDGADLQGIAMEKPIARNMEEAHHIADRLRDAGIPNAYLENWPYEPDIAKLRDLLWQRGGDAGRPYIARSQAEHGGPHSAWFWDGELQGGGALTDMLCHALAGNHVLLSDPESEDGGLEPVSVSADTETLKWAREDYAEQLREEHGVDYEENPADDYARATVRYEGEDGEPLVSEATGSWCYVGSGVRRSIERVEGRGPESAAMVDRLRPDRGLGDHLRDDAVPTEPGHRRTGAARTGHAGHLQRGHPRHRAQPDVRRSRHLRAASDHGRLRRPRGVRQLAAEHR